jgi:hypothetical protein
MSWSLHALPELGAIFALSAPVLEAVLVGKVRSYGTTEAVMGGVTGLLATPESWWVWYDVAGVQRLLACTTPLPASVRFGPGHDSDRGAPGSRSVSSQDRLASRPARCSLC